MKKLFIACFMLSFFVAFSQEKEERPKNAGVSNYDEFKNLAFDMQDESDTLKKAMWHIDNEIKTFSGGAGLSVEKLIENYRAIKTSIVSSTALTAKISELLPQGKELLDNAKSISPKTKAPAAIGNTKKSISALNISKANLDSIKELMESNLQLLKTELTNKGEIIE